MGGILGKLGKPNDTDLTGEMSPDALRNPQASTDALNSPAAQPSFGAAVKGIAGGAAAGLAKQDEQRARIARSGAPTMIPQPQQPIVPVDTSTDYLTQGRRRFAPRDAFFGG